ncbi:hypothetical protein SY83_04775 [Paenibacillus swuensis]|uniref:HAMP domain-containing protein n=1 Tax=Paenibacillus swuensis TaxID=1178515 RepID=A0A172TFL0_9BACL|nr:sensor histidine kinase [Paenibacillus swuensis]ANE45726.1 hypothetical protein SY83_04775 [Paenibacillus swuensis]
MKRFYEKLSVRYKLLVLIAGLCFLIISAFGYWAYRIATSEVIRNNEQTDANLLEQTMIHLDFVAQDVINASNFFILSKDLHKNLTSGTKGQEDINYLHHRNNLSESIMQMLNSRHYIKSLIIYSDAIQPITYSNYSMNPIMPYEQFKETDYYRQAKSQPGNMFWGTYESAVGVFPDRRNGELLLMGMLMNGFTGLSDGFIVFGLDVRELIPERTMNGMKIYIANEYGEILSDSEGKETGNEMSSLPYFADKSLEELNRNGWKPGAKDWIISHAQSSFSGWHLVIVQPHANLVSKLGHIKTITVLTIAIALTLSLLISWYISSFTTQPILRILNSIRHFQRGDFEQSVEVRGNDEFAQLGSGYNTMVGNIRTLIHEQYDSRLKLKESELALLQSQINPHFLYNTLNTMSYMAQSEGSPKIAEMLYSLSSLFRISLSDGAEWISLEKEFELMSSYLFLQQERFPDQFQYEVRLSPEAAGILIPKLVLQPFVENALIHGIQPSEHSGFIQIHAELDGEKVRVQITDNGVGMDSSRLNGEVDEVGGKLGNAGAGNAGGHPPRTGYAIRNVRQRLALYYGDQAKIHLMSREHQGTQVTVEFPANSQRLNS